MKGKKKFLNIIAVMTVLGMVVGCAGPNSKSDDTQTEKISTNNSSKGMQVSVSKNKVSINLNKVGTSGTAKVYAYGANEYQTNDKIRGISKDVKATGTLVGNYKCGSASTLTRDRYEKNGKDNLYDKYYVVKDHKILCGPVYASTIASAKKAIAFKQTSIKGLMNDNLTDMTFANDLGAQSITVNIGLDSLLCANEDQNGKKLTPPADAYSIKVAGKTYYFSHEYVTYIDNLVIPASTRHMNVIGILCAWKNDDYTKYPKALRYNSPKSKTLMGTNTSNDKGRDYLIATMEFLAKRYSQSAKTGLISNYVISNEIDFTHYFYDCGDLNTFMEEYSRTLRLSNLAVKKYAGDIKVTVPFTHYWKGDVDKLGKECPGESLKPCDMLNWLATYTNARGAYDWAIAPHCYGSIVTASNEAKSDVKFNALTGSYKTTKQITFSNFEVWDQILSQSKMKYNGKQREVYLTESGASSGKVTTEGKNQQAATLAQAYYKVAQMPFVKSYNYYRLQDNEAEAKNGLSCGLLDAKAKKKPAYEVYKFIDTKDSLKYSNPYLKYIDYKRNGNTEVNTANGKIKSWKDTMVVYNSSYDWNRNWNMNNVYKK